MTVIFTDITLSFSVGTQCNVRHTAVCHQNLLKNNTGKECLSKNVSSYIHNP
jgi:hypothetical protein